jgi:hypothetical protein
LNAALQLFETQPVKMSTAWAMPSRWTFQIPPIHDFIERHIPPLLGVKIVDPFCGTSKFACADYSNDVGQGGMDAGEFCEKLLAAGVQADVVLFDPPYSPRQISECYKSIGRKVTGADTQNAALYARVRKPLAALLRPGGVALSFGWQSSGFSKQQFRTTEILLVQHGGAHNDTICVAQVKL